VNFALLSLLDMGDGSSTMVVVSVGHDPLPALKWTKLPGHWIANTILSV